ncbi:hypothetical protein [Streptomyces sp. NPDC004065]|uniref:hypothetical protein n=1 Tax=Streptomyces sp. NPDC004065 TaxID=3364689 RepID=UPI00384EECE6
MHSRSTAADGALTGGCVLLLVLVADATAALLVLIVLALRGLGRLDLPGGTADGAPAVDRVPALCCVGFAVAAAVAGVLLVRGGNRLTGALQLALAVVVACAALGVWHDARDRSRSPSTPPADRLVDASGDVLGDVSGDVLGDVSGGALGDVSGSVSRYAARYASGSVSRGASPYASGSVSRGAAEVASWPPQR